jgi:hypothetical protein
VPILAIGNRLYKASGSETSWYIRDASGNVMAIYTVAEGRIRGYEDYRSTA